MVLSSPVGLYFYDYPNFGDMLNVEIAKLMGIDIQYAKRVDADATFIGSLLTLFIPEKGEYSVSRAMKVWGSGFIKPPISLPEKLWRPLDVYALRGQVSLERLRRITGEKLENVALGDPGLLASRLIDASKISKKHRLGIIPHYVDKGNPLLEKIAADDACILDIQESPIDFLLKIAECENVISSSLHGLIAADSLGIPNIRMIVSDKLLGGDYKFDDYYSAFGIKNHHRVNLNEGDEFDGIESIREKYAITPEAIKKICEGLIAAFPYKNGGLGDFKEDHPLV